MLVLESQEHIERRASRLACHVDELSYGCLVGAAVTSDAFHPIIPDPSGRSVAAAVQQAIEPYFDMYPSGHVAYVNAHGTSTRVGDAVEAKAVRTAIDLIHDRYRARDSGRKPALGSLKGSLGHTLGASGAIEMVIMMLCMEAVRCCASVSWL